MSSGPGQNKPGVPPNDEGITAPDPGALLTSDDIFGDLLDEPTGPLEVAQAPALETAARKAPIKVQVSEPGTPPRHKGIGGGAEPLPEDVAALLDAFSEPAEAAARVEAAAQAPPPPVVAPAASRPVKTQPVAIVPEPAAAPIVKLPVAPVPPAAPARPSAPPRVDEGEPTLRFTRPPLVPAAPLQPPPPIAIEDDDDLLASLMSLSPDEPEPVLAPAPPPTPAAPPAAALPPVPTSLVPAVVAPPHVPPASPAAMKPPSTPAAARTSAPPPPAPAVARAFTREPELIPDDGPALLDEEKTPPPAASAGGRPAPVAASGPKRPATKASGPSLDIDWPEDLPAPASRTGTKFQALTPRKSATADLIGIDLAALAADALGTAKPGKKLVAKEVARAGPSPAPAPTPEPALSPLSAAIAREISYGPYRLLEKVAVGGMAEVFRAKRSGVEGFEKVVAVKRILGHLSDNKEFVDMFIDEAKMVAGLTHPNIVQIFDLGKIDKSYYIAMEYVHGRDLRTILRRAKERGLRVPLDLSVLIVSKVCSALEYAHRKKDDRGRAMKIVHRDVSPQNVLISFEGDVKLTDFGIAKAATKATHTDSGALRGKLLYMSPEQAWGKAIDRRSDIFSLGICFYEMITDNKPFLGTSEMSILEMVRECRLAPPSSLNPKLPERLEKVVMKALERDPEVRYQDGAEMYRDLERVLHERQPPATGALPRFMELLFDQEERGDPILDDNPSAEHRLGAPGLELEFDVSSAAADKTPVTQPPPDPAASRATSDDPMSIQRLLKRFGIK